MDKLGALKQYFGHAAFRPGQEALIDALLAGRDVLKIIDFLDGLPYRPTVGAFTATATAEVKTDIIRLLKLRNPLSLTTDFDRANLYFDVIRPKGKLALLLELLRRRRGKSGIVYCATRKAVERVCEDLKAHAVSVTRYHAGLEDEERRKNQEDFVYDRRRVMVATNAFGMGIDKSNVSFVIHYNMPKNLESYYQEAGRAGRDGMPADCILLGVPRYLRCRRGESEALRRGVSEDDLGIFTGLKQEIKYGFFYFSGNNFPFCTSNLMLLCAIPNIGV